MRAVEERVPGDVSAAAFWLVAGAIHPDAELTLRDVGVNPTRRAVIDILRAMGAEIEERPHRRRRADDGVGEPLADLVVRSSELRGDRPRPGRRRRRDRRDPGPVPGGDGRAAARPSIRGAGELRHKESDRIAGIAAGLRRARRADRGRRRRPAHRRRRRAPRRRDRQPRRPPPGDDLRDRRPRRRGRDHDRAARRRPPSPIPASSTTSKGYEHDQARRPHRPPGGPFAVRRDAAGGLRLARHRRDVRALGPRRRSSWPTPSPSCAATTSSAPTSRSRTRSGSSRWSTA